MTGGVTLKHLNIQYIHVYVGTIFADVPLLINHWLRTFGVGLRTWNVCCSHRSKKVSSPNTREPRTYGTYVRWAHRVYKASEHGESLIILQTWIWKPQGQPGVTFENNNDWLPLMFPQRVCLQSCTYAPALLFLLPNFCASALSRFYNRFQRWLNVRITRVLTQYVSIWSYHRMSQEPRKLQMSTKVCALVLIEPRVSKHFAIRCRPGWNVNEGQYIYILRITAVTYGINPPCSNVTYWR